MCSPVRTLTRPAFKKKTCAHKLQSVGPGQDSRLQRDRTSGSWRFDTSEQTTVLSHFLHDTLVRLSKNRVPEVF